MNEEDKKGGLCEKCGTWKGGEYGVTGEGDQTYHICLENKEEILFCDPAA